MGVEDIKKNSIIYCITDDYMAIYVNGSLEYDGDSIPNFIWLGIIDKYQVFEVGHKEFEIDSWYINELSHFPKYFKDIPKDMIL